MGECSCVSVHGANRLGTNSLLDLVVFGRAAGNHIIDTALKQKNFKDLPADSADRTLALGPASTLRATASTRAWPTTSAPRCKARWRVPHPGLDGRGCGQDQGDCRACRSHRSEGQLKVFNTARIEALEVENLIEAAQATMISAAARPESRGARVRGNDYPSRRRQLDEAHPLVLRGQPATTSRSN